MILYPDRPDIRVWGKWMWALPGAAPLPFPIAFGTSEYDPEDFYQWDGKLGEDPASRDYSIRWSTWSGSDGSHYCGDPDTWLHGEPFANAGRVLVDAGGVPLCCDRSTNADHNCDFSDDHDRLPECLLQAEHNCDHNDDFDRLPVCIPHAEHNCDHSSDFDRVPGCV